MEPTFISSGNTLDILLTSEIDRVGDVKVLAPFPRCGHCPLIGGYVFNSNLDADDGEEIAECCLWHRGVLVIMLDYLLH